MFSTIFKALEKVYFHFVFRLKQCLRIFNWMPQVSMPAILILGCLMIVKLPKAYYYPLFSLLFVIFYHFSRKDIPFLKKAFVDNWRFVIFLENLIIYLIFLLLNINYRIDFYGIYFLFSLGILSFFYPKKQPKLGLKWNFIPNYLFEWKAFLRRYSWLAIIIFIISIFSGYNPASLIFFGIFILDYISKIYLDNECKEVLQAYFNQNSFQYKIRKNLIFLNVLLLPSYLVFLTLNYSESIYLMYYFAFMNLYYSLIITRKYKIYSHKQKTNNYNMGVFLEYFFCSATIIPALFVLHSNIKSAQKNIKNYVKNN